VQPLSVRVGAGWNPFERANIGGPLFWQLVEQLEHDGWDSLWLSDVATGPGVAPLPMLAAVAARTERLKLGTSVLVAPPRNPLLLAKELATVDVVSGGRLFPVLGIGQAAPDELAALGVPREERGARLEECMAIVRELWRGEPVTFDGRFSRLEQVTLSPRPTRPRIELWLGGSTPPAVRRVARVADGWLASAISPARFGELVELLRVEAAAAGRSVPEDHFGTVFFAAATESEAAPLRERRRRTGKELPAIAVGAEGVRGLLHAFRDAGATKFVLYPLSSDPRAFLEQLKGEVVDRFEAEPVLR
jgi:probable F420-dependent oxidoreductase